MRAASMRRAVCPSCSRSRYLGARVGGKLGGLVAGAAVGAAAKQREVVILGMVLGALVGHWLDREVLPTCPECRVALRVVDTAF